MNKRLSILLGFVAILALIFWSVQSTANSEKKESDSWPLFKEFQFTWEGLERSYWLYRPSRRKLSDSIPVLFVLHGGGGLAKNMPRFTKKQFHQLADRDGFLVVYPQGYGNQWNDGRDPETYPPLAKQPAWKDNLDDVGFLVEILERLDARYSIDREKVFVCGNSNGGFMSNRLLCDRPDVFRGAGVITATMDKSYFSECHPNQPVGLVIMNGTADDAIPYDGGPQLVFSVQRGDILSTEEYTDFWVAHNNCQTQKPQVSIPDQDGDGTHVSVQEYTDCDDHSRVVLYTIHEGGHTWPGAKSPLYELIAGKTSMEIVACEVLWEFFQTL